MCIAVEVGKGSIGIGRQWPDDVRVRAWVSRLVLGTSGFAPDASNLGTAIDAKCPRRCNSGITSRSRSAQVLSRCLELPVPEYRNVTEG